ncbi:Siderophore synthetase component [Amycolatopsis xylanica]|uniref:Siderophore synthetase component n=1 Tax=Amycolatopsis xylanica TaxID=589385 RepID=A0A1H2VXQ8_9PSEU|nr:Siderophore synthetase component [Amycolatopsis xylanica]
MVSSQAFESPLESTFATELARLRPELPYRDKLPGARAAVLDRLWRGFRLDPLPRITHRSADAITLEDGRRLTRSGPVISIDGKPYDHPAAFLAALGWPEAARLEAEVAHSVAAMALARAGAPSLGYPASTLPEHEQSIVDGHPLHPCCRNRTGFTVADHLAYGPEFRPIVALDLLAVSVDRCLVRGDWPDDLRSGSDVLLPVHPWQSANVLPRHGLRPTHPGALPAEPLLALRTLAPIGKPWQVKTALSTQLTSAVRDISGGSVETGVALSAFLRDTVARLDGFSLQENRAAAAVLIDGSPHRDLAAIVRDSPAVGPGETVLPIAALTARPVSGGCPPLCSLGCPAEWLAEFAAMALPPLLTLLAWGVALEAHEQNLLLVLEKGRPRRLIYRDLADIRLGPDRLRAAGLSWPGMPDRFRVADADLRAKLFATFFATTMTGLVGTLAEHCSGLWDVVGDQVRRAYAAMPDGAAVRTDRAALLGEPIPTKPLTLMRLAPETTAWAYQPNPFA